MKWILTLLLFLAAAPLSVAADEAPLPLPVPPPQCAGVDPAAVDSVEINGEQRIVPTSLALSCLLATLDVYEADAPLRDRYWQGVLQAKAITQLALNEIHQKELVETSATYENALDDAAGAVTFWKYAAVGTGILGVGIGAAGMYYLVR